MTAEFDLRLYIDLYLAETSEQLDVLEQEILLLGTDSSDARLKVISRLVHTIKASSHAMGYGQIVDQVSQMENSLHATELDAGAKFGLLKATEGLRVQISEIAAGTRATIAEPAALALRNIAFPVASGDAFARFHDVIQRLAHETGKEIKLGISDIDFSIEQALVSSLTGPILHILRNCVDHGIEPPLERLASGKPRTGQININVAQAAETLAIEITDDGRGICTELLKAKAELPNLPADDLKLVFAIGLSSKSEISTLSGRGLGMDIVRNNMQEMGGQVEIQTELGVGSKFTITLPCETQIIRGVVVSVGESRFVIPSASIIDTIPAGSVKTSKNTGQEDSANAYILRVGSAGKQIVLAIDNLIGDQEVLVTSVKKCSDPVSELSEATIIDVPSLLAGLTVTGKRINKK